MISTDGGIAAAPPAFEFNCFDPIDEDDIDESIDATPIKPFTLFDETGFGSDTLVTPESTNKKQATKKTVANDKAKPPARPAPRRLGAFLAPRRKRDQRDGRLQRFVERNRFAVVLS